MGKAGLICLVVFSCLTLFVPTVGLQDWDKQITDKVVATRSIRKNKIMLFFTNLGRVHGIALLILLLAIIPGFQAFVIPVATSSLGISWILAYLLKRLIKRPRPVNQRLVEEIDHSFPSFHGTCSSALFCCVAVGGSFLYPDLTIFFSIISVLFAGMIGFSRGYLGIHYLSDVVGGWFFGTGIALIVQWGFCKF